MMVRPLLIAFLIVAAAWVGVPAHKALARSALQAEAWSDIVLIGYEPWFGPKGYYSEQSPHFPILTSRSTAANGRKGYDSSDPMVIDQHSSWLADAGVDGLLLDHSNGTACTFGDLRFCEGDASASSEDRRAHYGKIRDNVSAVYARLSETGSPLSIVPLLGAAEPDALTPNGDGETSLEKQIRFFLELHDVYPSSSVMYEGRPLFTIFVGAAQSLEPNALWRRVLHLVNARFSGRIAVRVVAGYMGQQPHLLEERPGPSGLQRSSVPIWSWIERLHPDADIFPSFVTVGSRVEAFTVQLTSPPIHVNALEDWKNVDGGYHPELVPRNNGRTFKAFMAIAQRLRPRFLIVNQWNCFCGGSDGGIDYETSNDFEPSSFGGLANYNLLRDQIYRYRHRVPPEGPAPGAPSPIGVASPRP